MEYLFTGGYVDGDPETQLEIFLYFYIFPFIVKY